MLYGFSCLQVFGYVFIFIQLSCPATLLVHSGFVLILSYALSFVECKVYYRDQIRPQLQIMLDFRLKGKFHLLSSHRSSYTMFLSTYFVHNQFNYCKFYQLLSQIVLFSYLVQWPLISKGILDILTYLHIASFQNNSRYCIGNRIVLFLFKID